VETGVQETYDGFKRLDSGFRRNEKKAYCPAFYEIVKVDQIPNLKRQNPNKEV